MPGPKKTTEGMLLGNSVYEEWSEMLEKLHENEPVMQDESLQQLLEETGELVSKLKPHYTKRNDMGNYQPMTLEEFQDIRKQYRKCLKAFDKLAFERDKQPDYKQLKTMLLNDYNALNRVSENALPPLAEVITGASVPVAELYAIPGGNTISGAMSSRSAIEYTDQNGQIHRGFFTEDKTVNSRTEDFQTVMDRYIREYPQYKAVFDAFMEREKQFNDAVYNFKHHKAGVGEQEFDNFLKYMLINDGIEFNSKQTEELYDVCHQLAKDCEPSRNIHSIFKKSGIKEGTKIAQRASAMTDVAAAFGKKDLLAGSERITVMHGKKKISGVFMEAASLDGIDLKKVTEDSPYLKLDMKEFDNPTLLRSLADLQILDYLCANTDRHNGNFFLRLDTSDPEHPTISGVQGIDNDNSFGTLLTGGVMQLATNKNLKVISSDMADKVLSMKQADLEQILEPYQFTRDELDAAFGRLVNLQGMIKNGKHEKDEAFAFSDTDRLITAENEVRVIRDDEWEKLTLDSLTPEPKKIEKKEQSKEKPEKEESEKEKTGKEKTGKEKNDKKEPNQEEQKEEPETNIFYKAQGLRAEQVMVRAKIQVDRDKDEQLRATNPQQWEKEQREKEAFRKRKEAAENRRKAPIRYTKSDEQTHVEALKKQLGAEQKRLQKIKEDLIKVGAEKPKRSKEFKQMYGKLQEMISQYDVFREKIKNVKQLSEKEQLTIKRGFSDLAKKRKEFKETTKAYLDRSYVSERTSLSIRKSRAAELDKITAKAPKSWHTFSQGVSLSKKLKNDLAEKNGFAFSVYQTNQLRDMMKKALYDNVAAMSRNDPKRMLGMKALEAQDRLWKFSQTQSAKEQPELNQKQKLAFNQVNAESQTAKDLKTLIAYSPKIQSLIDQENERAMSKNRPDMLIKVDSLTPRQARTVLGMLFAEEMKANGRGTVIRQKEERNAGAEKQVNQAEEKKSADQIGNINSNEEKNRIEQTKEEQVRMKIRLDEKSRGEQNRTKKEKIKIDLEKPKNIQKKTEKKMVNEVKKGGKAK